MCNMSCHVPRVELPKKAIKVAKIEWVLILTYVATRGVIFSLPRHARVVSRDNIA